MNEGFIRLIAALAFCDAPEPSNDEHRRWTEILRAIWKTQHPLALAFLASINRNGLPNEPPAELLLRAHQMAKALLPELAVKQQAERRDSETETNHDKLLRDKSASDPFLEDANLTRDAYCGQGEAEPDPPTFTDRWGNVRQ